MLTLRRTSGEKNISNEFKLDLSYKEIKFLWQMELLKEKPLILHESTTCTMAELSPSRGKKSQIYLLHL